MQRDPKANESDVPEKGVNSKGGEVKKTPRSINGAIGAVPDLGKEMRENYARPKRKAENGREDGSSHEMKAGKVGDAGGRVVPQTKNEGVLEKSPPQKENHRKQKFARKAG